MNPSTLASYAYPPSTTHNAHTFWYHHSRVEALTRNAKRGGGAGGGGGGGGARSTVLANAVATQTTHAMPTTIAITTDTVASASARCNSPATANSALFLPMCSKVRGRSPLARAAIPFFTRVATRHVNALVICVEPAASDNGNRVQNVGGAHGGRRAAAAAATTTTAAAATATTATTASGRTHTRGGAGTHNAATTGAGHQRDGQRKGCHVDRRPGL